MLINIDDGKGEPFRKVFATWAGGYLTGDSWRLNSGIEETKETADYVEFIGASGSSYKCHKDSYGVAGGSNYYVLSNLEEKFKGAFNVVKENPYKLKNSS
jgi:hypothetical protein